MKGKGFRGALNYNLKKVEIGAAIVLDHSFAVLKEQSVMREIALVKMLRPNLAKYFYHTSINFPPEENLADEKMKNIARDYLAEVGFNQHQYAVFRHFDADHPHLHILVNRIGYDGNVVSDSKDYQRSEKILRVLEKKYGLRQVISSKQAMERAMTRNELEMMKRTDEPSVKMKLQETIKGLVREKLTTEQFIKALEEKGIDVLFNQASTGFVSGISYGYAGLQFKGAHLGNAYKWQAIKTAIGYEQERDRAAIYQANLRTRRGWEERGGISSRTAVGNGAGTNETAFERDRAALQQCSGQLQEQLRKAYRPDAGKVEQGRSKSTPPVSSDQGDNKQGGTTGQTAKQDRRALDHPALPDLDLSRVLLDPGDAADHMDQAALNEFKKKKRKKKRLKI
ncbi:MAG: Relaxase/mobilization nuclease-like protein [Mucilaginibacter sp.]|nr:Relaxase/mobilization nuclease-like protein [Mucilaginibacter sp.]